MLLVLKLCPIQVIILLPLRIKLTTDQLLLIFLCNFSSFFSYVRGTLVTNYFSVRVLIHRYLLAIQQIIIHKEHLRYPFWSIASNSSRKSPFFADQMYALYRYPSILSSSKNINNTAGGSRLSFLFLWLWSDLSI